MHEPTTVLAPASPQPIAVYAIADRPDARHPARPRQRRRRSFGRELRWVLLALATIGVLAFWVSGGRVVLQCKGTDDLLVTQSD